MMWLDNREKKIKDSVIDQETKDLLLEINELYRTYYLRLAKK